MFWSSVATPRMVPTASEVLESGPVSFISILWNVEKKKEGGHTANRLVADNISCIVFGGHFGRLLGLYFLRYLFSFFEMFVDESQVARYYN